MKKKMRSGRPPRVKDIEKAHKLKDILTVREISWALLKREDPKTVYRWLRTPVGEIQKKLST